MTCPKCGTLASRPIVGGGVECSLCMTVYSPERIAALSSEPSYYSLQPEPLPPRGLVARMRGALRGAAAGWRGDV
jgi:hypothetical protein